jgi:hypothetical protein
VHRQTCITPRHNLSTFVKSMKKKLLHYWRHKRYHNLYHTCQKHTKKNFKLFQTFEMFKKCTFTTNTSPTKYQISLSITKTSLGPCLTHVQNSHVDFGIMAFVLTKYKVLAPGLFHFMDNFIVNHIFKGGTFQQTSKITNKMFKFSWIHHEQSSYLC